VYIQVHESAGEGNRVKRPLDPKVRKCKRMQVKNQGQQIKGQREGQKILNNEVMTLNRVKDTSISIQKCFFATYCQEGVNEKQANDQETINIVNRQSHTGNVCRDVYLLQNNFDQT